MDVVDACKQTLLILSHSAQSVLYGDKSLDCHLERSREISPCATLSRDDNIKHFFGSRAEGGNLWVVQIVSTRYPDSLLLVFR